VIDPSWDALYRQALLDRPALGGRLAIHLKDGRVISGEKAVADAHPHGARPMDHAGYVAKFRTLAGPVLASEVLEAFLRLVDGLPEATPEALSRLNPPLPPGRLHTDKLDGRGIFDHGLVVTDR
jgi:2-methylcitrate dehydratase